MSTSRHLALGWLLSLAACAPTVDYASLRSAAETRQREIGSSKAAGNTSVQSLLMRPLTAESAAQIAVLNNRGVRAAFEEAGLARASLVQALRLPNPTAEAAMRFRGGDERPELELAAMIDLTDLLLLPVRGRAARAELDAAKLAVVGAILDLSFEARRAFYGYQAALETLELRRTVAQALNLSADTARRLRDAGNITELDLANEQAFYEESKLALQRAEVNAVTARERVNAVLGLWGRGVAWQVTPRLPEPAPAEIPLEALEARAVERSLDLALAKQRFAAAAQRANAASAGGWLPELKAGVSAERDEEWGVGPAVELELPLFYQGQGEVGTAKSQMRREQNVYTDLSVRIRASARTSASRLSAAREAAAYYQKVLLPMKQKIVDETQLQFNAMSAGIFQLLQAKRDQVETAAAYVEQVREYWLARNDVEQLLSGRLAQEGLAGGTIGAGPVSAGGRSERH